ncbi:MAG: SYNERG-CTERM sorting domain-containing protein [Synergistaceae bacterium]|nr:SYNERG-CTERM sorting domain-containing protein [Synergistaceae bacterium]
MSKKRFILFALVAALVLGFAGSAFAAPNAVHNFTWSKDGPGDWTTAANWNLSGSTTTTIVPNHALTDDDEDYLTNTLGLAGFAEDDTPAVTINSNVAKISIPDSTTVAVEQILFTGTYDPDKWVEVNIGTNAVLYIVSRNVKADTSLGYPTVLQLQSDVNVKFTGAGRVVFVSQQNYATGHDKGAVAEYRVRGNATVEFQVRVESPKGLTALQAQNGFDKPFDAPTSGLYGLEQANLPSVHIAKTGSGNLNFNAVLDNNFVGTGFDLVATLGTSEFFMFVIQDGEVGLGAPSQFGGPDTAYRRFVFSDFNDPLKKPTLTALWSGSKNVGTNFDTTLEDRVSSGNGIIKVAQADGILNLNATGAYGTEPRGTFNGAGLTSEIGIYTKTGPGTLRISRLEGIIDKVDEVVVEEGTLRLSSIERALQDDNTGAANAAFDDDFFSEGMISVSVDEGGKLQLDKGVTSNIASLGGDGVIFLDEGSRLNTWGTSAFAGKVTDRGSIGVLGRSLTLTGQENDFTGNTFVGRFGDLVINSHKNLGGSRGNTIFLEAHNGHRIGSAATDGGRITIADGTPSVQLPNLIYLGNGRKFNPAGGGAIGAAVDYNRNVGEARIRVFTGSRLELPSNITYNANTLYKEGGGELWLTGLGQDSTGDGTYIIANNNLALGYQAAIPPTIKTALRIFDGFVRIENRNAADRGDIIVDFDGSSAIRPILSIANGIYFSNSVLATNQAVIATELKSENLKTDAGGMPSAIGTGLFTVPDKATSIRVRVSFKDLGGTVSKGQDFYLLKATRILNLEEWLITPEAWDVKGNMDKNPFTPYISGGGDLYFTANMNIDVPEIGSPNVTEVAFGKDFTIRIPVVTDTGVLDSSAELSGPLVSAAAAKIATSGNELVITGKAPAAGASSEDIVLYYNAAVTSKTDRVTDTLGYANYKEGLTLRVTENPGTGPVATGPDVTGDVAVDVVGQTLTAKFNYTLDGAPETANAEVNLYKGAPEGGELLATYPDAVITATDGYTFTLAAAEALVADFAFEYDTAYTAEVTVKGSTHAPWTFERSQAKPVTPPVTGSSSGGCDAGFGVLGLLAATGAVALLRKKD